MSNLSFDLHSWWGRILSFLLFLVYHSSGLTTDGILLLSFKYCVLSDPLGVLETWTYSDQTPCSWNGVVCGAPNGGADSIYSVTALSLPNSQLLTSIPADLGFIQHLLTLDLSNNSINGSIPYSLYNSTELKFLDFSNNLISGELLDLVGGLKNLEFLNLSDNALAGKLPENLTTLPNLTVLSLKNNYFYGDIPSGFDSVKLLDLSSNLISGSLPTNFGSGNLNYLNVSYNKISGDIPMEFGSKFPTNATIDLSFNNLTGEIPESSVFFNQDKSSFSGNPKLCGKPLRNLCPIPSTMSTPPNDTSSSPTSPPAIAAMPKTIDSSPSNATSSESSSGSQQSRFGPTTIVGIVVGDIAGIAILAVVYIYILKKRKNRIEKKEKKEGADVEKEFNWGSSSSSNEEKKWLRSWACMIKRKNEEEDSSDSSASSETEEGGEGRNNQFPVKPPEEKKGELITVDGGENALELETLLKASAYILGATGSSIIYKAVLDDGTTLAVRRIGENGLERFRDFETQIRVIAKLVHPNLVRIRGFYWGSDEKLVIYDFVPNGSLANARYRKVGSSPCPLPWDLRLKIARGTARGLTYIHDKKQVHGNLKPSNILLGSEMDPKIGDFGLERLVMGENSYKAGGSARNFGSKRSTTSRDSFQDLAAGSNPSLSPSSMGCISPYYAPELLRNLKPSTKWDVYSFGVILLELLTGKVIVSDEFGPASTTWSTPLALEEKSRVLRMVDMAIRGDMDGKEDALLALLKLAYGCISPVPQKRPHMKEALQGLDKFPSSTSSSSNYFGHL